MVERGGKVRDKARLGIRFTSVVLADGTRVPSRPTRSIVRGIAPQGRAPRRSAAALSAAPSLAEYFGGAKGAAIGAATGAGAGTAAVCRRRP
jgi:hypothetical protein